jgi:hypothetical protein
VRRIVDTSKPSPNVVFMLVGIALGARPPCSPPGIRYLCELSAAALKSPVYLDRDHRFLVTISGALLVAHVRQDLVEDLARKLNTGAVLRTPRRICKPASLRRPLVVLERSSDLRVGGSNPSGRANFSRQLDYFRTRSDCFFRRIGTRLAVASS